mgnify:CR=1 FL=1
MKKYLMSMLALVLGIGMVNAHPVDQSRAKYVGQQFVQANFEQTRANGELTLVYTATTNRGAACFYVYNVGNEGFVIVSADDIYRPIVGYSDQGAFDAQNINPALNCMLNNLIEGRSNRLTGTADPATAAEWETVMNNGTLRSLYPGRAATYLLTTTWNQDSPYNMLCPTGNGGPGGRCYAGCVATAMSQVMKFWEHPAQGTGSHSYNCPGHGQQSANFGATTYDWKNMPNSLSNNSPEEEKLAVATLMYHCGVAVDMEYAPDGSGSQSPLVPGAISNYFGYAGASVYRERASYSREAWNDMVIEQFDMGWPVYYSGCDNGNPIGCHAFVTDGYNEAGLYHWNWGWSGSGDGWFDFDAMDYSYYRDAAVFNYVPAEVYNSTAQAPTNFNVTPADNNVLQATMTWVNPSKTLNNANLSTIDMIVVERNGEIIYTENNVTPGATMTVTDVNVPRFDSFDYTIYAVIGGNHGKVAYKKSVPFGPTCSWKLMMTTTSFQGWRGGAVLVYNAAGTQIGSYTTTSSGTTSVDIDVPVGTVSFGWSVPTDEVGSMSIVIKDSQNATVYNYSGSSNNLEEGIFLSMNNSCGSNVAVSVPSNALAVVDDANNNNIIPTLNVGLSLAIKNLTLGVSATHVASNLDKASVTKLPRHIYWYGQYKINPEGKVCAVPTVLVKYGSAKTQFEANTNFYFNNKFWLGASYRANESVVGLAGIILKDRIYIGYSYDCNIGENRQYSYGSHEIFLSWRMRKDPHQKGFYQSTRLFN